MKHPLAVAAVLFVVTAGTSCTGGGGDSSKAWDESSRKNAVVDTPTPDATPSPTDAVYLDDTTPELSLDDAAKNEALSTAVAAWRAFARPDLDFDAWWAGLEPMLTQRSAESYFYTDPANVVALTVSEAAQIVDAPSGYEVHVEVSTDRGGRTVVLLRGSEDERWQVDRFVLPGDEG